MFRFFHFQHQTSNFIRFCSLNRIFLLLFPDFFDPSCWPCAITSFLLKFMTNIKQTKETNINKNHTSLLCKFKVSNMFKIYTYQLVSHNHNIFKVTESSPYLSYFIWQIMRRNFAAASYCDLWKMVNIFGVGDWAIWC